MASPRPLTGPNVAHLLGGTKVLGAKAEPADMQRAIREGLPYRALEALAGVLRLSQSDITEVVGMAARTLARRKKERYLTPLESDRVFRIARITQLAAETLGDVDRARTWLGRPNRALGGEIPLTMLDTEIGTHQVAEVLHHINYGIYA
jgi:putative toxin-antitoxin system antitoxin component (TIGR02293 family)